MSTVFLEKTGGEACRLVAEGMLEMALMTLEGAMRDLSRGASVERRNSMPGPLGRTSVSMKLTGSVEV